MVSCQTLDPDPYHSQDRIRIPYLITFELESDVETINLKWIVLGREGRLHFSRKLRHRPYT